MGLIDQTHKQGNHLPKIPAETRGLMVKLIAEAYENNKQPTKSAVYQSFRLACERRLTPTVQPQNIQPND